MFINFIIFVGILFFSLNFETFYTKHILKNMYSLSIDIKESLEKNGYIDDYLIFEILKKDNFIVDIYKDNIIIYTNRELPKKLNLDKFDKKYLYKENLNISKKFESYIVEDLRENIEFLYFKTNISNEHKIIIKTPITSIKDSVYISLKFLIIIFIPIMILSIFIVLYLSKKFTKPIIELNELTRKISNLDFTSKIDIKTNDEIEMLGNSINKLSSDIEKSLNELKYKNIELEKLIEYKNKEEILKREFVSSVSHELKTPITIISGYTQGLMSEILNTKEEKDYYLKTIYEESEKMTNMVNELLDLYKLESRTLKLNIEKVNLKDFIFDIIKKFEFKTKNINLEVDIFDIYIYCDKLRLQQVMNNFLDNAIHHVNSNKIIKIYTENIDDKIKLSVYNSGENILDTEKIWYSFSRLDEARTSTSNRVGLGLSISKEILKMHKFDYGVINKDKGVEFYFYIK